MRDPTVQTLFAWAHLSDIHYGHGDAEHGWDQSLVLAALRKDLVDATGRGCPKLDAILVTGDVAFSGKSDQYAAVGAWVTEVAGAVGVESKRIFVVPGNHDVDRAVDADDDIRRLLHEMRRGGAPVDSALGKTRERARLAQRMGPYLAFAKDLGSGDELYWVRHLDHAGLRLRLVGLNTALLSQGDHDKGTLQLGKEQLVEALAGADDELILVLSHHPLRGGWLTDEKSADDWIKNYAHIHLFGHVKDADSEDARSGAGGHFVRIAAGAVHKDKDVRPDHGYSIAAIIRADDGSLAVRIWARRWSPGNAGFRPNVDIKPEDKPYAEHILRYELSPGTRSASSAKIPNIVDRIADALDRRRTLLELGEPIESVTQELLDLKRESREGRPHLDGERFGADRYVLLRKIGQGGFATVWLAFDHKTGARVALKILHRSLVDDAVRRDRFLRGARKMSELNHVAVASIIDIRADDDECPYFTMEYFDGDDLRALQFSHGSNQVLTRGRSADGECGPET